MITWSARRLDVSNSDEYQLIEVEQRLDRHDENINALFLERLMLKLPELFSTVDDFREC